MERPACETCAGFVRFNGYQGCNFKECELRKLKPECKDYIPDFFKIRKLERLNDGKREFAE